MRIEVGPTPALRKWDNGWFEKCMMSELKKVQIDLISKGNWTMDESQEV